jgi:uncharacterized repeat protein (TIGR03803 family)
MEKHLGRRILALLIFSAPLSLSACGGSSIASQASRSGCTTACYVSGTVSGLANSQSVKLENNGGGPLIVAYNANDYFTFSSTQSAGSTYDVTVASHPPGIVCSVADGSGTLSSDMTDVAVSCATGSERILYSFAGGVTDGADPNAGLIVTRSGNLYGTTNRGGASDLGTIFEITATGTETILHSFAGGTADGANPVAGLVIDKAGNLYGTTDAGGAHGLGTVFEIHQDGTETILHSFAGSPSDGANPVASLIIDGNGNLYGTTANGGAKNRGTVFEVSANGSESLLHSFAGGTADGANPQSALAMDLYGYLYGTTSRGGAFGQGTVFTLNGNGTDFILHSFVGGTTDGANPSGDLLVEGNTIYGTTEDGSFDTSNASAPCANNNGCGTVFGLPSGGGNLEFPVHSFSGGPSDGEEPMGGLIIDGAGNLYGTTYTGGSSPSGGGTVFEITSSGTETLLHSFTGGTTDGANPIGGVVLDSAGNLYGTTESGGANDAGTVFEIN